MPQSESDLSHSEREESGDEDIISQIEQTLDKADIREPSKEEPFVTLPRNINSFKLGKLIDIDPMEVFATV